MDSIVRELLNMINNSDLEEEWLERSSIMSVDGKLPIEYADCLAMLYLLKKYPAALLPSYIEGKFINKENTDE